MSNKIFKYNTTIRTPRLLVRPMAAGDADFVYNMRSFYETYKWTYAGQWLDIAQSHAWIKNNTDSETNYSFIIESLPQTSSDTTSSAKSPQESCPIGSMGIHGDFELGYMLHPDYWGKGYATEAVAAFIAKAFEMLPEVRVLTAMVDSENTGSMGVMKKCGFKEVKRNAYVSATMGDRVNVRFEVGRPG